MEGNNGPRWQAAAIPEEEKDCRDGYRRVELGTAIDSGKKRTNIQDPQEDPGTGIGEASERDPQRVTNKQTLDLVEGSTTSEAQEVTAQEELGMGSPGHPKS
jgi:hypothetical protein